MLYGEPWAVCHICGFEHPQSHLSRHYKSKRLVCADCLDEPGHTDFMEVLELPEEISETSEAPLANQGAQDSDLGYGEGGYGEFGHGE